MVRLARAELFNPSEVAILHVIGRVTRRCFLFGFDPVSERISITVRFGLKSS